MRIKIVSSISLFVLSVSSIASTPINVVTCPPPSAIKFADGKAKTAGITFPSGLFNANFQQFRSAKLEGSSLISCRYAGDFFNTTGPEFHYISVVLDGVYRTNNKPGSSLTWINNFCGKVDIIFPPFQYPEGFVAECPIEKVS